MRISDWSSDVCSSDLLGRGPHEPAAIHPLGKQAHALAVIPEQLDQIAPLAPKGEQRAGMRALLQNLLRHPRQAAEALAHVRRAASQEYPRARQSVVYGKSVSVSVGIGGSRRHTQNKKFNNI